MTDVGRALAAHPGARDVALARFRELGGQRDEFRLVACRQAWADALTRAEDWLELQRGTRAEMARAPLRDVRRRVERTLG